MAKSLAAPLSPDHQLADELGSLTHDPLAAVRFGMPWCEPGALAELDGPRRWQAEVLDAIGSQLRDPATRHQPLRLAIASGHGIGKSALVGMVLWWALSTCVDTKVVVTANTATQLRTKTWPEVSGWFRRSINAHWWQINATGVLSVIPGHQNTWRADAIPWAENRPEAFQGLHNQGRRLVVVCDEASAIADIIAQTIEGALTDENTEIIWIALGNPTRNTGWFRSAFGRDRARWRTWNIDSRTVEGTNKPYLTELAETYGEDNDIVRYRVRGLFPQASSNQFIGTALAEAAAKREATSTLYDPLVMAVDVARFGDDASVIQFRRGRDARSIPAQRFRGLDTMQLASRAAALALQHRVAAVFVDGGGVGGGVVDRLRQLINPVLVHDVQFGGKADRLQVGEDVVYLNKRAEMYGLLREWLAGGAIADDPALIAQLIAIEYGYRLLDGRDAIILESKEHLKQRVPDLGSPDDADALALTFAFPIGPARFTGQGTGFAQLQSDYDPYG